LASHRTADCYYFDSVEDYLNKKKVETIDESEEEVSWTPNFSGILSKPPDAINK
jgi:hypothetical protein